MESSIESRVRELEVTVADLRRRQAESDSALREAVSRVRAMESEAGRQGRRPDHQEISAQDAVGLLRDLQEEVRDLKKCTAVEFSIQDELAEGAIMAGAAFFGERMSSSAIPYRSPNDAWIHIDFTPDWKRPILFESATKRLTETGLFIIVTRFDEQLSPASAGLALAHTSALRLVSGRSVRAYVFRRGS